MGLCLSGTNALCVFGATNSLNYITQQCTPHTHREALGVSNAVIPYNSDLVFPEGVETVSSCSQLRKTVKISIGLVDQKRDTTDASE